MLCVLILSIGLVPAVAHAQQDAFLLCANLTDREQRLNCLDEALQSAVNAREAADSPAAPAVSVVPAVTEAPAVPAPPVTATVTGSVPATATESVPATVSEAPVAAPSADPATSEPRLLNLFGLLDRDDAPEKPVESMQARVAELDYYKPDVLTITLDNGQVWRQLYARRYNLREGDAVRIYSTGWGVQFRLEAERFNGFIQVERLR